MDRKVIPIKSIPREVKSDPQFVINERRRTARKSRIAEVQQKIQKLIDDLNKLKGED